MQRRRILIALSAAPIAGASRSSVVADEALWAALHAGGAALLLRHAVTEPGIGDPAGYRLDDCTTQRNLSAAGRAQAVRIGQTLAARQVRIAAVLSSRWCRCLDTARLAFPDLEVEAFPALDSFFDQRAAEASRTVAVRARIAAIAAPANVALVTHQVNILALTGAAAAAGEAIVVRPGPGNTALHVIGRLRVD